MTRTATNDEGLPAQVPGVQRSRRRRSGSGRACARARRCAGAERAGRRRHRGRRLGRHQVQRGRDRSHRPLGDGPGHAHRPRPARLRGARVRLEKGEVGISDARQEPRPQPHLGRHVDRRQPRHSRIARVCAQRWRGGAHDAAAGGGGAMEGAGRRAHGRRRRHQARQIQPQHDLRQGGRGRGQADGARSQGHQAQGPEGLEGGRQGRQAPRHGRQADRQADLRHRREAAGHAHRLDDGCAGVRRQGQELRRGQSQGDARRAPCPEGRRHGRCRGGGHLVAGQPGAEGPQHRLGGGTERQGLERVDHGLSQGGPRRQGRRVRRQPGRRCAAGDCRGGQEIRGGVLFALSEPRLHGADELHGQGDGRQVRGLGRHAERRRLAGGRRGSFRSAARPSARSTSTTSAAASAGAACRTTPPGRCRSPSRSPACR